MRASRPRRRADRDSGLVRRTDMKRRELLRHLHQHGCLEIREGAKHTLWLNPETGTIEPVPRHSEIQKYLARKICRGLSVPEPKGA